MFTASKRYGAAGFCGKNAISESEFQAVSNRFFNMTTEFADSLNWQTLSGN
jgi:hypothetical protein